RTISIMRAEFTSNSSSVVDSLSSVFLAPRPAKRLSNFNTSSRISSLVMVLSPAFENNTCIHISEAEANLQCGGNLSCFGGGRNRGLNVLNLAMQIFSIGRSVHETIAQLEHRSDALDGARRAEGVADHGLRRVDPRKSVRLAIQRGHQISDLFRIGHGGSKVAVDVIDVLSTHVCGLECLANAALRPQWI